jgi:hypothetical protein
LKSNTMEQRQGLQADVRPGTRTSYASSCRIRPDAMGCVGAPVLYFKLL